MAWSEAARAASAAVRRQRGKKITPMRRKEPAYARVSRVLRKLHREKTKADIPYPNAKETSRFRTLQKRIRKVKSYTVKR